MIAIDMEMPDSCVTCRFSQGDYGFCHAMPENFCGQVNEFEEQGRPEWCPLKCNVRERVPYEILDMICEMMEDHGASGPYNRGRYYGLKRLAHRIQRRYGLGKKV